MAYGIDTGGGTAGGLARGLTEGAGLYNSIVGGAQDRQLRQQEAGLRQQEFGLQQRSADRLDEDHRTQVNEAAIKAADEQLDTLLRLQGNAKAEGNQSEYDLLDQHIKDVQNQQQDHRNRIIGGSVYDAGTQAKADAKLLETKQATPADLGAMRYSNVYTLTGHPAIDYVDHPDHPGGVSPIGTAVSSAEQAMASGDHQGAIQALHPLAAPHISGHEPGHDLHYQGIDSPYGTPDGDHPHIGQLADLAGAKGTLHAATSSSQEAVDLIHQAHDEGATEQQQGALNFVHAIGGPKQLKQFGSNSGYEQEYADRLKAGEKPKVAATQMAQASIESRMDAIRESYIKAGRPIPQDLKEPEKEAAVKAYMAANPKASRAQAAEIIYAPGVAEARIREAAEAGLRSAQADEARARAGYYQAGGHKTGLAATLAPIEDELNDPDTTPDRRAILQKAHDDAIQSYAHQHDKLPRSSGDETTAQMQRRATEQAKADLARDPTLGKSVNELAGRYYQAAKIAQDRARAAAAGPALGGAAPSAGGDGGTPDPLINPATGKPWWESASGG